MYSATVWTDPALYASHFGAVARYDAFLQTLGRRAAGDHTVFPFEMDQALLETLEPELEPIRDLVMGHRLAQLLSKNEITANLHE